MKRFSVWCSMIVLSVVGLGPTAHAQDPVGYERVTRQMVAPPALPAHDQVAKGKPKIVEVRFVVEEKEMEVANGAFVQAMTFNGTVPGPIIVVHQDDYVELTLVNPAGNTMMHNIDFHASTGALGGGDLTKVNPGQEVVLRFKATRPVVFVYHCAPGGAMVPFHVVSGMNGAIMVLPRDGLVDEQGKPVRYDRAYYIGEQDYYIPRDENGMFRRYHSPAEAMGETIQVMQGLIPTHIVFNGRVGAPRGKGRQALVRGPPLSPAPRPRDALGPRARRLLHASLLPTLSDGSHTGFAAFERRAGRVRFGPARYAVRGRA